MFRSLAYPLRGAGPVGTGTGYSHAMAITSVIDAVLVLVVIGLIALLRRTTAGRIDDEVHATLG